MFEINATAVGAVITEPVRRAVAGGEPVVSFQVCAGTRRFDRSAEEWVTGDRLLTTVFSRRALAERAVNSVRKGDRVLVSGRLRTREQNCGGYWRTVVELEAEAIGLDLASAPAERALPVSGVERAAVCA